MSGHGIAAGVLALVAAVALLAGRGEPEVTDLPGACPGEYGATVDENGQIDFTDEGTFNIAPGSACEAQVEADSQDFTEQLLEELDNPAPRDWVVKDTRQLDGECLVGRSEIDSPTDRFSRHPLPGDCSRYPIGSTVHTGGLS